MFHEYYVQGNMLDFMVNKKIKHQNISQTQLKSSWKDINPNNELK